jgi:hypothetical protein
MDHKSLVTMRQFQDLKGHIDFLFHKIRGLDYDLIYQPG